MRPLRVELQGFGPFRELATIDFTASDLVVLTGPTGAGKSTIIDAIAFALYGSVVRYDNIKLVAPVVNAVSNEARVRLDFAIGDDTYTAVRVVRRTGTRASTKEARLERGDEVLASTAAEVSAAVVEIVGLDFAQFTKTIVLPQGEFAQFLNVKPSSRQRLLRQLLGLGVFAEVGKAARLRGREMQGKVEGLSQSLSDDETTISENEVEQLAKQVDRLAADITKLEAAGSTRSDALLHLSRVQDKLDEVDEQIADLRGLAVPAAAKAFASKVSRAEAAMHKATTKRDAEAEKLSTATDARADLPTEDELNELLALHSQRTNLADEVKRLGEDHDRLGKALDAATKHAEQAGESLRTAEEECEHVRMLSGAHGIAASLHVGDDCPVCTQLVETLPRHPTAASSRKALTAAESKRDTARSKVADAIEKVNALTAEAAAATARLASSNELKEQLDAGLEGQPTEKQALALSKRATTAQTKVDAASERLTSASDALDEATGALETLTAEASSMRQAFTEARDRVVALGPPMPTEVSLAEDWAALTEWGKATARERSEVRREFVRQHKAADKDVATATKAVVALATPYAAPSEKVDPDRAAAILRDVHSDARLEHANAVDRLARLEKTRARIGELDRTRVLVDELGKHLASGAFERWILADVMADLAERATARLLELSGGAYSLVTDGRDFQICDHRNADELRGSRTLSGGETFLTSLSLALALSESITELASTATPPLKSIFLDEGFGTLDGETLDTVASAIEELGSTGKLVGIVTHIDALAERIPDRIDVRPSPTGSTVR